MMLDVIYDRCVVRVGTGSMEGFVAGGESCYIPARSAIEQNRR